MCMCRVCSISSSEAPHLSTGTCSSIAALCPQALTSCAWSYVHVGRRGSRQYSRCTQRAQNGRNVKAPLRVVGDVAPAELVFTAFAWWGKRIKRVEGGDGVH